MSCRGSSRCLVFPDLLSEGSVLVTLALESTDSATTSDQKNTFISLLSGCAAFEELSTLELGLHQPVLMLQEVLETAESPRLFKVPVFHCQV